MNSPEQLQQSYAPEAGFLSRLMRKLHAGLEYWRQESYNDLRKEINALDERIEEVDQNRLGTFSIGQLDGEHGSELLLQRKGSDSPQLVVCASPLGPTPYDKTFYWVNDERESGAGLSAYKQTMRLVEGEKILSEPTQLPIDEASTYRAILWNINWNNQNPTHTPEASPPTPPPE